MMKEKGTREKFKKNTGQAIARGQDGRVVAGYSDAGTERKASRVQRS